jgi:DedD protein
MGLLSIFNRPSADAPAAAGGDAAQIVAAARTRAKRRLVGAVVLLGIGVIAFPLLFETQPRPIPVDIPIEIPRKDAVPPLAIPPARPAPAAAASVPAPVVAQAGAAKASDAVAPASAVPASAATAVAPSPPPANKAAAPKVQAKPPAPVEAKAAAEAPGRFVVQLGAFADANGVRETRAKVDKLGLQTYTQTIDTDKGKRTRVRVGPYASRDEAEQVAAKVKAAGLPAVVLAL